MNKNILIEASWALNHLKKVSNKAGPRYSPKLNVDLPISEIFDGISRTKQFYYSIRSHYGELARNFVRVNSRYKKKEIQKLYRSFKKEIIFLLDLLEQQKQYNSNPIPWEKIEKRSGKSQNISWELIRQLRDEKEISEKKNKNDDPKNKYSEDFDSDIHYLYECQKELEYFQQLSTSTKAKLANNPFLLLTGVAGTGKTHLLCDVLKNRLIGNGIQPAIMCFGEYFTIGKSVIEQISIQANAKLNKKQILKYLNNAGRISNCRALLIIDALNETRIKKFWKTRLPKLILEVKKYPNIALIISLRTGFEKDIITKTTSKKFVKENHPGFQFREWEAVSKFFHEFKLPLPEIPLLIPEFQYPLFLLLFCKAFQSRNNKKGVKKKQIFRGHEGATFIFESFIDSISLKMSKQFKIRNSPRNNIWDSIIEKIAEEMVRSNDDRISEEQLINIVENAYPKVNKTKFVQELERNLLVIKVPRYSEKKQDYDGYDFRFPFQKFSDHLIGRYLFKSYENEFGKTNKNLNTAKRFFSRRRKLGEFLSSSWNIGIIEALSIQCPEHLKGLEFFEIAHYLRGKSIITEAFIESIIWRKPDAFSKDLSKITEFINLEVIKTEHGHNSFLNAMISVSPIPSHPFNSLFLHKHLSRFSMPNRDSWWSIFLHYQMGEKGAVDRLIEWSWSNQNKSHISNESIFLCSIVLSWFLTTSNRFLRDKSTKALVSLLTNRLKVMLDLLKKFVDVNDPYVSERIFAVAYGVALRSRQDKRGLKALSMWVYNNLFKNGNPPIHILMRDYARGIIDVALNEGINLKISKRKINPPFGSSWPKKIPTEKYLRKKYYPEDFFKHKTKNRGFLSIWSSVMHDFGSLGDFGNYILNSAVDHWSGKKLGVQEADRKLLYKEFKKSLNAEQLKKLEVATNPYFGVDFSDITKNIKIVSYDKPKDREEIKRLELQKKKEMAKALNLFIRSLPDKKKIFFKKEIRPFINDRGMINDPLDRFNSGLAQRWVFNKVVQLGWDHRLHGYFDDNLNYHRADRSDHKPERIGKKYQWIALHELLARIADNFEFKKNSWSKESDKYEGSWQLSIRDIDPSCILKDFPNDRPNNTPSFRDFKKERIYNAWNKRASNTNWLRKKSDLPDPKQIMEVTDSDGVIWISLEGFTEWQDETLPEDKKYDKATRTLWYMTKSYLLKKKDKAKVLSWANKQQFMGRWMPESHEFYNIYLSEYPWALAFLNQYIPYYNHEDWTNEPRGKEKIPSKILVTDDEYMSSGSSIDCSTNETIKVKLPAKFIVDKMKLIQPCVDGRFFNTKGELVVFDPQVFGSEAPWHVFIRKDKLITFLNNEGLSIFWTVLGEKNMIGGGDIGQPLGWLEVNGVYTFIRNNLEGSSQISFKKSDL